MSGTANNRCVCGFAIASPKPLPLVGALHTPQTFSKMSLHSILLNGYRTSPLLGDILLEGEY